MLVPGKRRKHNDNDGLGSDQELTGYNYQVNCREKFAIQDVSTSIKKKLASFHCYLFLLKLTKCSKIFATPHSNL